MLTPPEWTLVTELVQNHLVNTVEPRQRLELYFPAQFVSTLSLGTRASDNAIAVVAAVQSLGLRAPDPPLLRLLRALARTPTLEVLPDAERVRAMLERAERAFAEEETRRAAAGDPYQVSMLAGREVFLDRVVLREALRTLAEDPVKLVLQVTGEPATGKSYSYQFISHLSDAVQFTPALVTLDETATPLDVVRMLSLQIAPMEAPPPLEDDRNKWNGYAALWLVTRAAARGGLWWFVLDGLNHLPATSEVHDFVHDLALAILNYKQSQIRLVLLGFRGQLPIDLRKRYLAEEVHPLSEPDVREFLAPLIRQRQAAMLGPGEEVDPLRLDTEIDDTVGQVLQFARKAGNGCYMRELGRAVEEVVDELAS